MLKYNEIGKRNIKNSLETWIIREIIKKEKKNQDDTDRNKSCG